MTRARSRRSASVASTAPSGYARKRTSSTPTIFAGRDLLVAAQRSHLRAWDAELRAAGVAIGHDAVGDLDAAVGPHRDRARDAEVDIIGMRHDHEDAFDSVKHKRFHGAPN